MILTNVTAIEYAQKKADNTSINMRRVSSMAVYAFVAMIVFGFIVLTAGGSVYIIIPADIAIMGGVYIYSN